MTTTRKRNKLIRENKYAAEVPAELIEDDTAWSPYLPPRMSAGPMPSAWRFAVATSRRRRSMAGCSS